MKASSLSTGTVAAYCGVDRATVLRWIKAGKLAAYVTPGGHHRVLEETLSTFLADMGLPVEGGLVPGKNPSTIVEQALPRELFLKATGGIAPIGNINAILV